MGQPFDFRKWRGTREAIGLMRMLTESGKELCLCFIDIEKAFDRVNW